MVALSFAATGIRAAGPAIDVSQLPASLARPVDFAKDILPIFEKSCFSCHGPDKQKGDYRLDSPAAALKGGENYTPAIKPGDSANSPLIHLVSGLVPDSKMPAKGDPLTKEQIGLLRAWIDQGSKWSEAGRIEPDPIKSHWAFQPATRPSVPQAANPIDHFVTAGLKAAGLNQPK